jgi:Fe2+ or Zn2+ uptake regulation protein
MTSLGSWPINRLHVELTRRRISWTNQRNEIYLAILRLGPCSRDQLALELTPRISKRTIARTLDLLLEIGVIIRLNHNLIELAPPHQQHRHYLTCKSCNRRIPYFDQALEKSLTRLITSRRFQPVTHQIEVFGLCEMCV